jgi:hypothetical protein
MIALGEASSQVAPLGEGSAAPASQAGPEFLIPQIDWCHRRGRVGRAVVAERALWLVGAPFEALHEPPCRSVEQQALNQ